MDVWGPARVRGQGHKRYFLLVVDDYSRYTTVFPLRSKGEVTEVLIDWIRGARRQLSESFGSDLPVLRLHSDRGGEFSSDLLRAFCRAEGIRQTFTLPASPQQNGIAERRIGMVMDVACTSMIHAAAPHFLWPFAVQYAAHQINLQPRVSLPETTPTLRWMGKVGNASMFRGLAPSGVSQVDPAEPVEVAVDSGAARGAKPVGAGTGGAETGGAEPGGAAPERVEPGGADSGGAEFGRAEPGGAEPERVEPGGTASGGAEPAHSESGGSLGVPSRLEPLSQQQIREWCARRCRRAAGAVGAAGAAGGASRAAGGATGAGPAGGATGAGAAGAAGGAAGAARGAAGAGAAIAAGAAGGAAGAGDAAGAGAAEAAGGTGAVGGPGGASTGGNGTGGAARVVAGDPGAEGAGAVSAVSRGPARPRPYYVLLLQQVLGLSPSPGPTPPLLSPPLVLSSPLPGPSPYSGPTRGLTERREPESPESRSALPVRTIRIGRRVSRPRPPPVPGTHSMTMCPSTAPQRVPLPSPPASSLPAGPDPASDSLRAASPAVTRFLAIALTDPLFESTAASALSASASVCPLSVGGECAVGTDVLEDRQEEFECFAAAVPHLVSMLLAPEGDPDAPDIPTPCSYPEAIEGPYSSQWQAAMDVEMASWNSTGTYVDEVPPPGTNIDTGMWIFRVKRPPGSPPVFKARYVARGFTRLDFSTAFLQGSLHEEIWLRRPPGFTGSFPAGTQWSFRRPVYGLRQAPREWHDTLRTTLAALGFTPSTADPSLFLRTDTTLPLFYVLVAQCTITLTQSHMVQQVLQRFGFTYSSPHSSPLATGHSLSAPPLDESVEPSGPYPELVVCLMHRKVHWDAAKRVLRYLCSTSSCEAEIYAWAMAAQELRWLTYVLTDLGEAPRSPPVLNVDNKAMLALC
ncbi:unnamed protein product [Closterium sp. NIES-54]